MPLLIRLSKQREHVLLTKFVDQSAAFAAFAAFAIFAGLAGFAGFVASAGFAEDV